MTDRGHCTVILVQQTSLTTCYLQLHVQWNALKLVVPHAQQPVQKLQVYS